ncbi:hypothetical protein SMICM17S_00406 [Streptomyces microflavus]
MNPSGISCWTAGSICENLETVPPALSPRSPSYVPAVRRPPLRHALPAHRPQRPAAARALPRPLAQLRRAQDPRGAGPHPAPRLRPGHHPLRPGQQLRPAARLRRTHPGRALAGDFAGLRDEIVISTKAGYHMSDGPYVEWGSRKYLRSSLDQSLKRLVEPRHLLTPTAPTPTPRSQRPWARWTPPYARARPSTSASPTTPPRRPGRPPRSSRTWARPCSSTSPATRCSTAAPRTGCSPRSTSWASAPSRTPRWSRASSPTAI